MNDILRLVAEKGGWQCHLCGGKIRKNANRNSPTAPSIDHKIPTSKGGKDDISNMALAHSYCNSKRGNLLLEEIPENHFDGLRNAIERYSQKKPKKRSKGRGSRR